MDKKELKKLWQIFLVENDTDTKKVAERLGIFPQSLGRKVNSGTLKVLELASILDMYGCKLKIQKKE